VLHGGQQGITGSHIYVMQAGTLGYGGASSSLLQPGSVSGTDSIGSYVLSSPGGFFTIPAGSYSCTPGDQVYLYALGGDAGAGPNSAAGLLAVLGNCPGTGTLASQTPTVLINEVSTIAAAYSMAGFATDATHVSSSGSALAQVGIRNAFANAAQLVTLSSGVALTSTPNGNGIVPQQTIYTLANALAACVNSAGPSTGGCVSLFGAVKSGGLTGTSSTNTATSAIYIAHNPAVNVGTLFTLAGTNPPFSPGLPGTTPPNDFTIGINYTGSGVNHPEGIAIDASGNAWIANANGNSVTEFSPIGIPAPNTPFTDASFNTPQGIAIDTTGSVFVTNFGGNSVTKLSSAGAVLGSTTDSGNIQLPGGVALSPSGSALVTSLSGTPFPALVVEANNLGSATNIPVGTAGMNITAGVALDFAGHAWVTNSNFTTPNVSEVTLGSSPSGSAYGTGLFFAPAGIAIDNAGNAWVADGARADVVKIGPGGASPTAFTGGGLDGSIGIAIDGGQTVWLANNSGVSGAFDGVSAFASNGTATSPATGYLGGSLFYPYAIAVDGSGDVWATNPNGPNNNSVGSVTELIGAGSPVVTPIAASLITPYTTAAALP
jgi:streptogramin lyase